MPKLIMFYVTMMSLALSVFTTSSLSLNGINVSQEVLGEEGAKSYIVILYSFWHLLIISVTH